LSFSDAEVGEEDQNDMRNELLHHVGPNDGEGSESMSKTVAQVHDVGEGHFPSQGFPGPFAGFFVHLLLHEKRRDGKADEMKTKKSSKTRSNCSLLQKIGYDKTN